MSQMFASISQQCLQLSHENKAFVSDLVTGSKVVECEIISRAWRIPAKLYRNGWKHRSMVLKVIKKYSKACLKL